MWMRSCFIFLMFDAFMRLFFLTPFRMCCIYIYYSTKQVTQMKMQCIRPLSNPLFKQMLSEGDQQRICCPGMQGFQLEEN